MPAAPKFVDLDDETFGEKIHRAARRCRLKHGYRYRDHAVAISQFIPISEQAFIRYEELEEVPADPRRRQVIYLFLLSLGVKPESLGLTEQMASLNAFDMRKIRAALHPANKARLADKTAIKYREGGASTKWSTDSERDVQRPAANPLTSGYVSAA